MAGPHIFEGGSDGDFANTLNWDTSLVPASGEDWGMNHTTVRAITAGLNQAAKTFPNVYITPDCKYGIASSAGSLLCNITNLYYAGGGNEAWLKGTIVRSHVVRTALSDNALVLDGILTDLTIGNARVTLAGTNAFAIGGRIHVGAAAPASVEAPTLTIPGTTDLVTGAVEIMVNGGMVTSKANLPNVVQTGGAIRLDRDATYDPTMALLQASGGVFKWRSKGTIARLELAGSAQFENEYNLVKTLTDATMYDNARMLLSESHLLTVTNGIRVLGNNMPQLPPGSKINVVAA